MQASVQMASDRLAAERMAAPTRRYSPFNAGAYTTRTASTVPDWYTSASASVKSSGETSLVVF